MPAMLTKPVVPVVCKRRVIDSHVTTEIFYTGVGHWCLARAAIAHDCMIEGAA